ncbi:MAG: FtsP/CotA-like multicopper oxidase with cupredoxin domain [Lysobacterales bacterium]|jgi:FtsP/CotA-like multicopper oxidase with cupredoxin domain
MSLNSSDDDKKGEEKKGLERREFIKLGASGVAATLAACAAPSTLVGTTENKALPASVTDLSAPAEVKIPDIGDHMDPSTIGPETWQEPWTWQPQDWPGAKLDLNAIRNQSPADPSTAGNTSPSIFSFNGANPGPTIRVRNDGEIHFRVRNTMGQNLGVAQVGPSPDPVEFPNDFRMEICALAEEQVMGGDPENPRRCGPIAFPLQMLQKVKVDTRPGWDIGGHINGSHGGHTTNIHTHGLHVFPQTNEDGSHSDNIFLRIIPKADFEARKSKHGENAKVLGDDEHVAELSYRIQLSFKRGEERMPHPPGTHWYHPHSHGSTHSQVASGMAGFLLVEGDVDDAINHAMTSDEKADPGVPTGPWDYRERVMLIQRVLSIAFDSDAGPKKRNLGFPPIFAINGSPEPSLIKMRPGATERWRVLNGSVDGAGTKRFMVLEGQFVQQNSRIWKVEIDVEETESETIRHRRLVPVTEQDFEDSRLGLYQLSMDGITLVKIENGKAVHKIRDLSKLNEGTENPFATGARPGESEPQARERGFREVFKNGDSLKRSFARPNEIYMTNANRSDVFFQAPLDSEGKVFTVFAKEAHIHTDNLQQTHQRHVTDPGFFPFRPLFDVVVAYIHVRGKPVEGGAFDVLSLNSHLPVVPPLLIPVSDDELKIPVKEASETAAVAGSKRCRIMSYSGTGGADFPAIKVPDGFAEARPDEENVTWTNIDGNHMLMPNLTATMGINPEFDLISNPQPGPPRKFAAHDPMHPVVFAETAEEWTVYNTSQLLWSHTDTERFPQPGAWRGHFESYPISRAEGQKRFLQDPEFKISSKGVDHPFHIHINPMWVLRIDVPDENGELHNVLPEPQWMDVCPVPRNGGRIVFRSRFEDFTGKWINHCHILMHEDNGMMQIVECTDDASKVNYKTRQKVASHGMSGKEVDAIYPKPSLELMYRQNLSFIDPTKLGYQEYPGFELEIPKISDS